MAGPGLATNNTATTPGHPAFANTVAAYVNLHDTTALTTHNDGDALTWDGTSGSAKWEAIPAGGSSAIPELVPLSQFTGASDSAKYRDACTNYVSYGQPIVNVPEGTTLDAGANNPFVLPSGFHTRATLGPSDEFGYTGIINIRHTGSSSATPGTHGVFKMANNSKGQKFTGVTFKGTSTTRAFVDVPQDASTTDIWTYVQFRDVSFDQFEDISQTLTTGFIWTGTAYLNNFSAARPMFDLAGSDFQMDHLNGFAEMGTVGTYSTRRSLSCMFRFPNSNGRGPSLYVTGSPTTPFRVDNFNGQVGVMFDNAETEGRPSPGTVGGDTPTDGLHCAGALYRISAGYVVIKGKHYGYGMRDPISVGGFQPGGFIDVRGTASVSVIGGVFQPYVNTVYPAWTRPDGVSVAVDTQPPLGWVSGAAARASFVGIARGPNATSAPVVFAHNGATVTTDGTVTVTTV